MWCLLDYFQIQKGKTYKILWRAWLDSRKKKTGKTF